MQLRGMNNTIISDGTTETVSGFTATMPPEQPITPLQSVMVPRVGIRANAGRQHDIDEANCLKLEALISLFHISLADIARVAGVSRPLVSRILSRDKGVSVQTLCSRLETKLPELIRKRQGAFFDVESVRLEVVEQAVQRIESRRVA